MGLQSKLKGLVNMLLGGQNKRGEIVWESYLHHPSHRETEVNGEITIFADVNAIVVAFCVRGADTLARPVAAGRA